MIKHEGKSWVVYSELSKRQLGVHDTEDEAKKQDDRVQKVVRLEEKRNLHLLGATGAVRTEMIGTKEHLVVPVVMLMEGVIHAVNAETPEFVPFSTLEKAAESWNGCPVTLGHPKKNGVQCSASDPHVLEAHGIGVVRNAHVDAASKKMLGEALIETSRAKRLHPDMYTRLAEGGTEEVSVGALVVSDKVAGKYGTKAFLGSWTFAKGDHLAFLPGGKGACSVEMGCGTHRAAMLITAEGFKDATEEDFKTLGGPGSGWSASGGHTPGSQGGKHADAANMHRGAAMAHRDAAKSHEVGRSDASGSTKNASGSSKDATKSSKETGSKPFGAQAANAYAKMAREAKTPADASKYHTMAAQHHEAAARSHDMMAKSLKGRALMDPSTDTPEEAATEEAAELIAYKSMKTVMDACGNQWDEVSQLIDDLIADETENPTESSAEEEAEEVLESARIDSIRMLCQAMIGALSGVVNATYGTALTDAPRYMAARKPVKKTTTSSDSNRFYIESVRQRAAGAR